MPVGVSFSREFRRELLGRVARGAAVEAVAREMGVSKCQAHVWWAKAGGMRLRMGRGQGGPLVGPRPLAAGGQGHRLNLAERMLIMRGRDAGRSVRSLAAELGRAASTISRELRRNRCADGDYHAVLADSRAAERAQRPKEFKLDDPATCAQVTEWMEQGWSPKLIAHQLAHADKPARERGERGSQGGRLRRVSHETIYRCLYVQTRGGLRADLWRRLSTKRSRRKPRGTGSARSHCYDEAFTIAQRPAEATDRAVPGHWEGDLIMGAPGCGAIGTLVERSSRFVILLHLPNGHAADHVAAAMIAAMKDLPEHLRRSITWDRGVELARYRQIQIALEAPVFFCDPRAPWQRGTNENTNRLLRFWFAKSSDLRVHTAADLRRVQDLLNQRPRPTLDYQTPAQRLTTYLDQAA